MARKNTKQNVGPRYDEDGVRLTDCCGTYSTYLEDGDGIPALSCKKCYHEVPYGQGDGSEVRGGPSLS